MFDMVWTSVNAFWKGKLFQNQTRATLLGLAGVGITAVVFVVTSRFMPLWSAALVAGLVGGAVQPFLFKDLKFQ
jgi:hypothetical protein